MLSYDYMERHARERGYDRLLITVGAVRFSDGWKNARTKSVCTKKKRKSYSEREQPLCEILLIAEHQS